MTMMMVMMMIVIIDIFKVAQLTNYYNLLISMSNKVDQTSIVEQKCLEMEPDNGV